VGKIIFLSKTANTELCKTGDSVFLKKKQQDIPKERHNGIDEKEFV